MTLAAACFVLVMSFSVLTIHPDFSIITNRFGYQQNQNLKTALYVLVFLGILPLALVVGPRLADAIAGGPSGAALPAMAAVLAGAFAGAIVCVKLSAHLPWGDGLGVLLAASGIWWIACAAVLWRATRPRPWPAALRLAGGGVRAAAVAGLLLLVGVLCATRWATIELLPLLIGALLVPVVVYAYERVTLRRLPRLWGGGVDLLLALILALAIPDVVFFHTGGPVNPVFPPGVFQYHHDFLLGPANQLLGGGALLVDDPVSQYGVGSIYFLAGWFQLAPIGYGTYAFLDGVLTALFYVSGYAVLRIVGVNRLLAGGAMAVAVIALIYNLHHPIGALPQQGPLRFGLPMVLLLGTVVALRWPRYGRIGAGAAFAALGVSSIWALEAFAYTTVTFAAMLALRTWLLAPGTRRRWVLRQVGLAAAACALVHLTLALATLAGTGHLPDWGQYGAYVHAFVLGGKAGEVTYGFNPWSPALAIGAAYLASAAAIVLLVRRRPDVVRRDSLVLVALTGLTAYAIALFSYTDNRSSTYLLPYVTLPLLLAGTIWLTLILRSPREASRGARLGSLAFALALVALMVASALPVGDRFADTALARMRPGGGLPAAMRELWHPPPIDPRAAPGEGLLHRYMPGERRSLVILARSPDLATEILMRSKRSNLLPLGDPKADNFVPSVWVPILGRRIDKLEPGTRMLLDETAWRAFHRLKAHPAIDPLALSAKDISGLALYAGNGLDEWILKRIGERFDLRPLYRDPANFTVVELAR